MRVFNEELTNINEEMIHKLNIWKQDYNDKNLLGDSKNLCLEIILFTFQFHKV